MRDRAAASAALTVRMPASVQESESTPDASGCPSRPRRGRRSHAARPAALCCLCPPAGPPAPRHPDKHTSPGSALRATGHNTFPHGVPSWWFASHTGTARRQARSAEGGQQMSARMQTLRVTLRMLSDVLCGFACCVRCGCRVEMQLPSPAAMRTRRPCCRRSRQDRRRRPWQPASWLRRLRASRVGRHQPSFLVQYHCNTDRRHATDHCRQVLTPGHRQELVSVTASAGPLRKGAGIVAVLTTDGHCMRRIHLQFFGRGTCGKRVAHRRR